MCVVISERGSSASLRQASSDGCTSLATLTCEEEVRAFDSATDDDGAVVKVAVVSEEGNLFLYQLTLSALPSVPVTHTCSIQYVSSPPKVCFYHDVLGVVCCYVTFICIQPSTPSPLPVLAVVFPALGSHMVTVAHSSYIAPTLESIVSAVLP